MEDIVMDSIAEVKDEETREISKEAQRFAGLIRNRPMTDEDRDYLIEEIKAINNSGNTEYILATLFPDFYEPARFPMMFPNPTAVFKHHDYFDVKPGSDGKILIQIIPHLTWGAASAISGEIAKIREGSYLRIYNEIDDTTGEFTGTGVSLTKDSIGDYFESVVLRACVARAFYVGADEKMSGFLQGSIDYFQKNTVDCPKIADVEDGYYKQFSRPNEGIRVVWFPKDYNDYNFEEPGGSRKGSNLYIYGSGLDNTQELRIDIIRHFEGFPSTTLRDYIDVRRPSATNAQSAMETMGAVHNKSPELLTIKPKNVRAVARKLKKKSSTFDKFLRGVKEVGSTFATVASAAAPFLL